MNIWANIKHALHEDPPDEILKICGDYYSPYYHLFYLLSNQLQDGLAVELGVDIGRGCASFALGGCDVIGLDHIKKEGIQDKLNQFPNFVFLETSSMPVPNQIKGHKKTIDFLHIDTEHSRSMALAEFVSYKKYLSPKAIVFFDDLHAAENSVLEFFAELEYPKIQDDRLHPVCGFGMCLIR